MRPGPRELLERRRLPARPKVHGEHPCDGTISESAISQLTERPHDAGVLLRVPAIIQTLARSGPHGWIVVPDDRRGDKGRLTDLAGGQVMADASQHDGLSINILRGLHLAVGIFGQNLVWDPAFGTERANLFEVQVVQLLEKSCLLV